MRAVACLLVNLVLASPATAATCRQFQVRDAVTQRVVAVTVCGWGKKLGKVA